MNHILIRGDNFFTKKKKKKKKEFFGLDKFTKKKCSAPCGPKTTESC